MGACQSAVVVHDQAADVSRHLIDFTKELECSRHGSTGNSSRNLNSKSANFLGSSSRSNMNASKQSMAPSLSERTCRTSATQNSGATATTITSSNDQNDKSSDPASHSRRGISKDPATTTSEPTIAVPDEIGSSQRQRKRRNHKRKTKTNNKDHEEEDEQALLEGSQNFLQDTSGDARGSMMRAKSFKSRVTSTRRNNCSMSSMDLSSLMDTSMPFLLEEDDF